MVQASFSFFVMALCVKWASATLPSLEIVFFRSLIGSAMVFALILRKHAPVLGRERGTMTLRRITGFLALTLFFYTIAHLPLATAVMLNYTGPIFAAIFSVIFLKEQVSLRLLSMILIAFAGVYFLVNGSNLNSAQPLTPASFLPHFQWNLYYFLGLLSAIFAAIAYISIRAVRHSESPLTVIFYFTAISTIGSLFYLPFGFKWPGFQEWLALAGVGVGSFYGQIWMTIALRRAPAALLSPFSYLTPLLSFLFGIIFWKERLTWVSLLGVFLIILGGSLVSYFETRREPESG